MYSRFIALEQCPLLCGFNVSIEGLTQLTAKLFKRQPV